MKRLREGIASRTFAETRVQRSRVRNWHAAEERTQALAPLVQPGIVRIAEAKRQLPADLVENAIEFGSHTPFFLGRSAEEDLFRSLLRLLDDNVRDLLAPRLGTRPPNVPTRGPVEEDQKLPRLLVVDREVVGRIDRRPGLASDELPLEDWRR